MEKTGSVRERLGLALGPIRPALRGIRKHIFPTVPTDKFAVPVSDGFIESLDCDVIHFPYQDYILSATPSIYNPHDLQHLHFPEYFTEQERERRDTVYRAACLNAQTIVVASQFVKQDVIEQFGINEEKIQVIPWSPPALVPIGKEPDITELLKKYDCPPGPYMLYPAMIWEHKNHLGLIEALAKLQQSEDLRINLICTGHKTPFYQQVEKKVYELGLENHIQFTGMIEYDELGAFYRSAEFVIVPTLFEAASAPIFEAWQHRVAVACSAVTSLPEQAGDAALLFDPRNVCEIADAVRAMLFNKELRADLITRGRERLRSFDLPKTAKSYRAVYRRAAGRELNEEDMALLA